jgi:hypothetical protein
MDIISVFIGGYHGGHFGDVLEVVLPSVLVIETFSKWTKNGYSHEHSCVKMFLMKIVG